MHALNGMNGPFLAFAALAGLIGGGLFAIAWHWHQADAKGKTRRAAFERAGAAVLGVAAFALVIALAPLLAPVWQFTGAGAGVVALIGAVFVTGLFAVLMIVRGKAHHWQGSTAMAVLFGTGMALVIGGWRSISRSGMKAVAGAGHSMGGFIAGNQNATAAAGSGAHGSRVALYAFAAVVGVFVLMAIRGYRASSGRRRRKPRALGPAATAGPAPFAGRRGGAQS
jgi:hypothetical protein